MHKSIILALLFVMACSPIEQRQQASRAAGEAFAGDGSIFSLYRSSVLGADWRMHVATFDARDGEAYNLENCRTAADLFGRQPGVTVRFWCEKGRFRP